MTLYDLKKITSEFDDVHNIIEKRKLIRNQDSKLRRRLKTKLQSYSFLMDLVGINAFGPTIVKALKKTFKAIGFKKVEIVNEKYGEEDLRLWVDDKLIIIEATGTEKKDNSESKAHQISKHIPLRQKQYPNLKVSGLFISNHDNKKHYTKRNRKSFDKRLIKIAESHNYTVMTTTDLLEAYISIKKGTFSSSELVNCFCKKGEFKLIGTSQKSGKQI